LVTANKRPAKAVLLKKLFIFIIEIEEKYGKAPIFYIFNKNHLQI